MVIEASESPIDLFSNWFKEAHKCGLKEPDAVALATADNLGRPSVRMVLLKNYDKSGFCFYTNLNSRKAQEMAENPNASMCFHWMPLERQVRIDGAIVLVKDEEADAYFSSRDKGCQIGAWASRQSEPLTSREELEKEYQKYSNQYSSGNVPRPRFWSGYRLIPTRVEFWQAGKKRLHERILYTTTDNGNKWAFEALYP